MNDPIRHPNRLAGIDVARYIALAGMVFVNFHLAMHAQAAHQDWLNTLFKVLEGKASATFVVLAGISLTLATRSMDPARARVSIARRALFLFVAGCGNLCIFPADILHYYGVYFLLALALMHARSRILVILIFVVTVISLWAQLTFDYSTAWNWTTLEYKDLWTWSGFLRNLFFNGFHPVLPWFAFLIFGLLLARLQLEKNHVQVFLAIVGLIMMAGTSRIAPFFESYSSRWLFTTTPMPPGPLYFLMGIGTASFLIGGCLWLAARMPCLGWMAKAGKMTLTLYIAHILIGMSILEYLDLLDGSAGLMTTVWCASIFLLVATFFSVAWAGVREHGPIELLMRKLTARSSKGSVA
ncbi:heparan-alpha-glucosaminide N-acetyltransferase domain-containing protein [Pseudoduganella sp. SL102]|uniref:DUF418 domain-containing protein n=1 Tax=Pseudoduganella sp. SL102 TaxID=2995154 RepID=UPI00248CF40E|nr:heparan-alpha-glucosaminide N-acetyltransferase domain-containing protein [Pseudoduganella sp. SL102]WBR99933.1 heparan-alpha-glucosaminide N-acetyltransferase domain-containing protein [Pseudoduganella sp. SL102]